MLVRKKPGLYPETKKFVFDVFLNGRLHNEDGIWQEFENYHLVAIKMSNYIYGGDRIPVGAMVHEIF
jgi:hypothetical protein